ncbi:MAG: electron transport complex subunit RsxC [Oscillospiraceae bacterium]|nr:electron transport complex subunit RsxC [Oscillospiraceae bacterium]
MLLADSDNMFVLACNKCFKVFESVDEPECEEFIKYAVESGKNVTGSANLDFLCNKTQTSKKLDIPEGTESVFVISCGLGVQTIADSVNIPVFAAANSLNFRGHHGMALTKKACDACAQCYLNITGGICPVVDCSKSLLNGQCGGAKNGKCEVDPNKDCAWEKIEERLSIQGRLKEFLDQPVQIRDYSKVNYKAIKEFVTAARESRLDGYYGGVHPSERKELSEKLTLVRFPDPDVVVIPLSMHSGAPATPLVQAGDAVKVGQKIGEAAAFISGNIHSSVSGTVIAVESRLHPTRAGEVLSVVIENDKKNEILETVKPYGEIDELSPDQIVDIVKDCGIVGMGGAGFPTAVKLMPNKPIDVVLLNGCECEPMLTADHRVLVEYADDVIYGLRAMMKAVSAAKGIIAIEDNKTDAIELLRSKLEGFENIDVAAVKTKYPQGAEKMLIKRVLGRQVPRGGLPADVGAVVCNVSTSKAVADAIKTGMPLIERVVTVTGERIKRPGNFIVKIGTMINELIDYCGGATAEDITVKVGGPMMGSEIKDLNVPVIKTTNGIIVYDKDYSEAVSCIKCGRCVDVCPMELEPLYFAKYHDEGNWQGMLEMNVLDCLECRCCEYICSSKIPLVDKIKAGKSAIREMKR